MLPRPIRLRRGRRTDLVAILEVLTAADIPVPPPDRAMLRRFRRIVADLGTDFYVAVIDEVVVGVLHVTYARHLTGAANARIEALVVGPRARRRGVGSALLGLAVQRAHRRGCRELQCAPAALTDGARHFLDRYGWRPAGQAFRVDLAAQGH